ncbi:trehalose-6-phosphate synthase [Gordonia jinhuaensis]|uniref:alpha,alpha-trehalose-phosphate synthase (ADP-forming) n=1 Tax=Gordonia jinhuaensis TaxID=1517702 RepID=A0A916SYY8_9ACTN|nr:trehalose-phosphate synthase [Gordonia jinhuaensis]
MVSGESSTPDRSGTQSPASTDEHARADFVVVANRLPVDKEVLDDGTVRWKQSPGGLVTALEPILRENTGAWVGWSGTADSAENPEIDGVIIRAVPLSSQEIAEYYEGFSNATLWPLYHDVIVKPEYHREWWDSYVEVNRRFAEAASEAASEGAIVWVQDYQLQLVPKMLRMLRPDLRIGFFLHIPFPPVELFMQLPWRREIVEGLLGADLIGFHLPGGAQNFLYLARRLAGYSSSKGTVGVRGKFGVVQVGFRTVRVGAFPISIDSADLDAKAKSRTTRKRAGDIRKELGNPKTILLGVDRLDYTKGIDVRLRALSELLAEKRLDPDEIAMIQLATPSRERVDSYKRMRAGIEQLVGNINGMYGTVGHPIVQYLHRPVPRDELISYYYAADVMLVTPLRDGMNLVAKEYVACHSDLRGALVLSEFTGAAAELRSAYIANPYDIEGVKDAIDAAVHHDVDDGRRRMRAMRRQVMTHTVSRWAASFLGALQATTDVTHSGDRGIDIVESGEPVNAGPDDNPTGGDAHEGAPTHGDTPATDNTPAR